jgi:conjugal transfer pilus assembly protein TrbC
MAALFAALLVVVRVAQCQVPSQEQIERRMGELGRSIPQQLEEAARRAGLQDRGVALDRLPAGPQSGADLERLAGQYGAAAAQASPRQRAAVMVFVSLSMPHESLRRLASEAAQAGVPLYFRGLRYGFGPGKTQRGLIELRPLVELGASVQIHPEAFEQYGVRTVPTFVVDAGAEPGCAGQQCKAVVAAVRGDVSLRYALQRIADGGDEAAGVARDALRRLDAGRSR